MRFKDQTLIVTGASEGIGLAVAQNLARDGAYVAMFARRPHVLEAAAAAICVEGGLAEPIAVDVTDTENFVRAIEGVAERRGQLDGLVNNAFKTINTSIAKTSLAEWRSVFAACVDAPFVAIQAAMPIMRKAGRGAIVNVASTAGVRARVGGSAYGAAKAALIQLSAVAAMEGARHGVRVNTVIPALTRTAAYQRQSATMGEALKAVEEKMPLGRAAEPEEVASAIVFLLSDEARFITGADLRVEGGAYWQ